MKILAEQYSRQILFGSLLIGAGLRWFQIGQHSFWYDEAFSGLTARLNLYQIVSNVAIDVHPPGYYILLHYWLQLGEREATIRSFSALFGLGAVALMYGLARTLFNETSGALAALGMAMMPFQVYFAQEARMYSLVIFLSIALMWLFFIAVTAEQKWLTWAGYAIISVFSLYVHYFTAFLLLSLHIWFLLHLRRYKNRFLSLLVADSLILLFFLPQLNQAFSRAKYYLDIEAWQAAPHVLSPLTTIYYLLFAHRAPIWIAPVTLFLTLAVLVLILWEGRRVLSSHRFEWALWLSVFVPIISVIMISWASTRSIYVERSFAVASPALVLLLARGALTAPRWSPTPYLASLLVVPIVITLATNSLTPDPAKPPLRQAMQIIAANYQPDDVSLHLQDASAIPALWYAPGIAHILANVQGSAFIFDSTHRLFGGDVAEWQSAVNQANRLWLTVMPGFVGPDQEAVFEEIEATYPRLMMKDWETVQLYLYDLRRTK